MADNKLIKRKHFYSCPGARMVNDYDKRLDDKGRLFIKVVGEHSLYDFIQSDYESSNIELLFKRFKNGDTTVKRNAITVAGQINDMRDYPSDIISVMNFMRKIESDFYSLPLELRVKFHNNYNEFALAVKDGSAKDIIDSYLSNTFKNSNVVKKIDKEVDSNGDSTGE